MRIIATGYFTAKDEVSQAFVTGLGNKYGLHLERFGKNEVELWSDEYFREDVEFFAGLISQHLVAGEIFCNDINESKWKLMLNPETHVFETVPGASVYITREELESIKSLLSVDWSKVSLPEDQREASEALKKLVDQLDARIG